MARILYGLCSVGIGHAVRSKVVLDHLNKKHDLFIMASHRAYDYLQPFFKNVHNIEGLELAFTKNKVVNTRTFFKNLQKLTPATYERLKKTEEQIKAFKPDLVISDWETYSSVIAKKYNLPLISIDNGHYILHGDHILARKHPIDYLKAVFFLNTLMRSADAYLIMLFPGTKLKPAKNIYGIDPIVRDEIRKIKPTHGNSILVYQSTPSNEELLTTLKKIKEQFIVYGFNRTGTEGNITFKRFDAGNTFVQDLAHAKALITNGGFTLISEALYLHKPMLVVPLQNHFEQFLNGQYVAEKGYGEIHPDLTEEHIRTFLAKLPLYANKTTTWTNKRLFATLDKLIKELTYTRQTHT